MFITKKNISNLKQCITLYYIGESNYKAELRISLKQMFITKTKQKKQYQCSNLQQSITLHCNKESNDSLQGRIKIIFC